MFRLLPGIFDIVPLQGEKQIPPNAVGMTGEKEKRTQYMAPLHGEKSTVRSDCATGGQLPAGAWSHFRARRQGAEWSVCMGVFSQTSMR
jgi:hypothetical protein